MPIMSNMNEDIILIGVMYAYRRDVKNPVRNMITIKMVRSPPMKENSSLLDLDLRLTLTKIGRIGRMQGDNIDITPVVKEIKGRTSI